MLNTPQKRLPRQEKKRAAADFRFGSLEGVLNGAGDRQDGMFLKDQRDWAEPKSPRILPTLEDSGQGLGPHL